MNRTARKPAFRPGTYSLKVAEDLGVKKWWKPTPEMEKYVKTYLT